MRLAKIKYLNKPNNLGKAKLWNKAWIENNRERYYAGKYFYRDKIRIEALKHYGNGEAKCVLCGYSDVRALVLDHINDDGAKQRKELKINGRGTTGGTNMYEVLHRIGYIDGLQTICANCNMIKQQNIHLKKRLGNKFYARDNIAVQFSTKDIPTTISTIGSTFQGGCME